MLVQQILKIKDADASDVATIEPDKTVADAAAMLSRLRIGALVVSPDGVTVDGILSERDVVRELGKSGEGCLKWTVADMMTREIVTCSPSDKADQILSAMTEGRFRHLPVMRDGKMIGLISIGDVVKARLSELSMEKDALQGLIAGY